MFRADEKFPSAQIRPKQLVCESQSSIFLLWSRKHLFQVSIDVLLISSFYITPFFLIFVEKEGQERRPKQEQGSKKAPKESSKGSEEGHAPKQSPKVSEKKIHQHQQQQGGPGQARKQENNGGSSKPPADGQGHPHRGQGHNAQKQTPAPVVAQPYQLKLFDHLPQRNPSSTVTAIEGDPTVHSATIKLGSLFRTGLIRDDDDRVAALISTFSRVVEDYSTPPNTSLSWNLDKVIKAQVQYLVDIRQHSMGMGNLIKYLRSAIACIPPDMSEAEAKQRLLRTLRLFLEEKIIFARDGVIKHVLDIIKDNDVIMTFGSSPLLRQVLLAVAAVRKFKLVVVDSRPLKEGLASLSVLSAHVKCVYTTIAGAASMMREVTHVLLGASSLLSNGAALAPAGTAMVAAMGTSRRVPVLFVAETYKFSEKVQLDSIVYNELGNPAEVAIMADEPTAQTDFKYRGALERPPGAEEGGSTAGPAQPSLPFQVLNLRYDLTPINLISAVVTETGVIPPTSIPVLIREFMNDQQQAIA